MVCFTEKSQSCSAEAALPCMAGSSCPPPKPAVCEDQVRQLCVPRYLLPCVQDNDCGPGFSCKEQESCSGTGSGGSGGTPKSDPGTPTPSTDAGSSSGSSGAAPAFRAPPPASDAGEAPPADDRAPVKDAGAAADAATERPAPADASIEQDAGKPSLECHPSGQKSCNLQDISCAQDSDCPAQFSCQTVATASTGVACAKPASDGGSADAAPCAGFVPPVRTEIKRCAPPYAAAYRGTGLGGDKSSSETAGSPGSTAATSGAPPAATTPVPQHAADPDAAAQHVKACSVAVPGADRPSRDASAFALLSMLTGLVWLRRRRG
jgi:MYXO-CTERM domain-containing protein